MTGYTVTEQPPAEPEVRIKFTQICKRCKFAHLPGKACPRCADTLDLDTGWKHAYNIANEKETHKDVDDD